MNRRTFALLIVLAAGGAAGCAPDRMVLEPYCVCSMPDSCAFSGSCDACLIGEVGYSTTATVPLQTPIELRNQAPNNENLAVGRLNSNDAHVTGYSITYTGGGPAGVTFYAGTQPVPAGGTGVIWVDLVQPATVTAPASFTAEISFIGYYDNGREFETEPFPIGVSVVVGSWACGGTDVVVCPPMASTNISQQNNFACGAP